jgi:hypothetical protein
MLMHAPEVMVTVQVEVTAEDCLLGVACEVRRCPLHRAFRRVLAPGTMFAVGSLHLIVYGEDGTRPRYPLPPAAVGFIRRVDRDRTAAPMSFEMDLPGELLTRGEG